MVMMSFAAPAMANDLAPQLSGNLPLSYPETPGKANPYVPDHVVDPSHSPIPNPQNPYPDPCVQHYPC
jgi:hypothetical protein